MIEWSLIIEADRPQTPEDDGELADQLVSRLRVRHPVVELTDNGRITICINAYGTTVFGAMLDGIYAIDAELDNEVDVHKVNLTKMTEVERWLTDQLTPPEQFH